MRRSRAVRSDKPPEGSTRSIAINAPCIENETRRSAFRRFAAGFSTAGFFLARVDMAGLAAELLGAIEECRRLFELLFGVRTVRALERVDEFAQRCVPEFLLNRPGDDGGHGKSLLFGVGPQRLADMCRHGHAQTINSHHIST